MRPVLLLVFVVLSTGESGPIYGRSITVAERLNDDRVIIGKWVRRLTNWNSRQAPPSRRGRRPRELP